MAKDDVQQVQDVEATDAHAEAAETDWKARARKWEKRAKENSAAADELAKLKESQMTGLGRIQARMRACLSWVCVGASLFMHKLVSSRWGFLLCTRAENPGSTPARTILHENPRERRKKRVFIYQNIKISTKFDSLISYMRSYALWAIF